MQDRESGELSLLDFNARPFTTINHLRDCGLDLPYLFYRERIGEPVSDTPLTPRLEHKTWMELSRDFSSFAASRDSRGGGWLLWLKQLAACRSHGYWNVRDPLPALQELEGLARSLVGAALRAFGWARRGRAPVSAESRLIRREIPAGPHLWSTVRPIWRRLLEETDEPSFFLSEAWIECWIERFGAEQHMSALVWSISTGEPVGCALRTEGRSHVGPFSVSACYLNASGSVDIGCEHNDVLALRSYRGPILDELVDTVRGTRRDQWVLAGVRKSTFDELRSRWPTDSWQGHESESPYVNLKQIRELGGGFLRSLSSNTRSQIRRSIRLYEGLCGEAAVEVSSSAREAEAWFSEMVPLHQDTWRRRGRRGAFDNAHDRAFYRDLIDRTANESDPDALKVEFVRVRFGDQIIGILFNLVYRRRIAFYQSGLRYSDSDPRLKPGLVSHALAIERYLERGDHEYDFLGGEPDGVRYKRSLSTGRRHLVWAQLPAPTLKMKLIQGLRYATHVRSRNR